ncbi:MAG: S41 family peptidase [Dysgonamonadaceae bacterium]|jgi:carboxyl-terminal processing protease|nr:S41 family peptidase [Dysgonamonadaceae bacterium]
MMNCFIRFLVSFVFTLLLAGNVFSQLSEKARFDISKNLNIYNDIFKQLSLYYVDSIAAEKIIRENIDFMLGKLDPYNEYISEEEMPDFLLYTTGEYGGIGAVITSDTNHVFVAQLYEGMPANAAGLQPGDILLEINGESLLKKPSSFASERLKGQPNTKVKIKFLRSGENSPREVVITRKRIEIDPVTFYGTFPKNVGYIYLSNFTANSAKSVRAALDDLKKNHQITSLIIDLRDNGGGVVEDCLEMLNLFVNKGELLLTMKGKFPHLDKKYFALKDPAEPDLPIAVIVGSQSASASEIFAGTIQDLDRGIVIGGRTYGKGLVQSTLTLPYNGKLKLTTAKYYIPSGRCIQAIDYSHKNDDGSVSSIPDSLTNIFYTSKGREVRDGGGITPDIAIEQKKYPTMLYYLDRQNILFHFVTKWRQNHPEIDRPETFSLPKDIWGEFIDFAKTKDFSYDRQSEKVLKNLREVMELEGYFDAASNEFDALEKKLQQDIDRDLNLHREQIEDLLAKEIIQHYYLARGTIIYSLRNDEIMEKAIDVLN